MVLLGTKLNNNEEFGEHHWKRLGNAPKKTNLWPQETAVKGGTL
jgi:hypothetical protein